MRFIVGPTVFLGSLIISYFCFISQVGSHRSWILELQLHNYSNPHGAYYSVNGPHHYCCCSTLTCYSSNINQLNCGPVPCTGVLTLCVEDRCVDNPVELIENSITLGKAESKLITLYPTLVYKGTSELETIEMHGSMYHQPSSKLPISLPGNHGYFIDNFTIPMKFRKTDEFHNPTVMEGLYGVISIASSFRFICNLNYYGDDCSTYCFRRSNDTFICSSDGNKICDEGYTNPDNDCKDQVVKTTTSSSCATTAIIQSCTDSVHVQKTTTSTVSIYHTTAINIATQQSNTRSFSSSTASINVNTVHQLPSLTTAYGANSVVTVQPSSCQASANDRTEQKTSKSSRVIQSSLAESSGIGRGGAASQQVHNTSTPSVTCDSNKNNYSTKFHVVLALLLLTYAGIGLFVAIRLVIYFGMNKKIRMVPPINVTSHRGKPTGGGTINDQHSRILNNPNYDANTQHTAKHIGRNNVLSKPWTEKSNSSSVYASLIANEAGQVNTSSDRQYEMIDSKSTSNIYAFISTQSNDQ